VLRPHAETSYYFHQVSITLALTEFCARLKKPPTKNKVFNKADKQNTHRIPAFSRDVPTYAAQQGLPTLQYITLRLLHLTLDCQLFFPFFDILPA